MLKSYFKIFLLVFVCVEIYAQRPEAMYPDTLIKKKLIWTISGESAFYLTGISYLQFIWYKDHEAVPFHFYDDAKAYLQIDKFGHAMGAYMESYMGYYWLRLAGVKKSKALIYGGALGLILQTPIEIFDGLYEGWGFSWPDMIANTAGSLFFIGQQWAFDDQIVKYKFSFWRSEYAENTNGYLGRNFLSSFFLDYNGHTYWLSTPINKLILKDQLPDWLSVAVGYSANGMVGTYQNASRFGGVYLPEYTRHRQFLLSFDVDWTRIRTRSKFLNKLFKGMFLIKMPAPTLEYNSLGQFKFYLLYW